MPKGNFPVPFGLSLERQEEQSRDCHDDCSHTSPGRLFHVVFPFFYAECWEEPTVKSGGC